MSVATHSLNPAARQEAAPIPPRPVLGPWVRAQAVNLMRHVRGLRDFRPGEFGSGPEAPSDGHLGAVNSLMRKLRAPLAADARTLEALARQTLSAQDARSLQAVVHRKHLAHARVQHIEKIWDFYFELFGQRQSPAGTWLLGADRIALDCYRAAWTGLGVARSIPAPPPFSYMRTGFGPATYRRGIPLTALGREVNPFPLVQLPYHRMLNPWTLGAVLHEVSHNLQTDLGLSKAVPKAIARTLLRAGLPAPVVQTWVKWNRETFADLSGLLLGGPEIVASLMDVVGRTPAVVYHFDPRGVHPTPWLRVLISCELLRRMGFADTAAQYAQAWLRIYPRPRSGALHDRLLPTARKAISLTVDAVCWQPMEELGGKPLASLYLFKPKDQAMVEEAAGRLAAGDDPGVVPERYLIGAARNAFDRRLATPEIIRAAFYKELSRR